MKRSYEEAEELHHDLRALSKENDQLLQENRRLRSYIRQRLGVDRGGLVSGHAMRHAHIFRLPDELLSMIVEFYSNAGHRPYLKRLKQIRLVHPRFAQLESVMKTLFRKVLVGPHRCTVDASLLKIAPLVREVDIKPVLIEVQTAYGDQNDPFVHETFNNHLISSWRVAYKSGATARAMAKVFNTLPCGKAFSIHIWNYIDLFPDIGYPGGAEIYALAFESFTRGNIRPSELNILIGSDSDCGPTWQCSDRVWNSLNFDNLRRLCFVGSAAEISSGGLHGPDLPALLSKSAASLHEVVFDVSGLSLFRGPGPFAMPALRRLSIVHTQIKFPEFSDWISQCAVLQELSITYSEVFDFENPVAGATSSSFTMWRPLFTCVRTHPSRMQLNFNPLVVETCLHDNEDDENPIRKEMRFIYVNHNTIEACHEKSFKESDNDKLNKKLEAVINYVSNAGEWTLNEMD